MNLATLCFPDIPGQVSKALSGVWDQKRMSGLVSYELTPMRQRAWACLPHNTYTYRMMMIMMIDIADNDALAGGCGCVN